MKKRDLLAGTGAIAAAFAIFTAAEPQTAASAPALEREQVIVVDPAGTSVVAEEQAGTLEAAPAHLKWGIAAALGTLIGGAIAALGFNRILNWLASSRKAATKAVSAAAKAPRRAARATVRKVAEVLEAPGRTAAKMSVLTLGALFAFALLDVSWKASAVVGGGALLWSALGWRKKKQAEDRAAASA
ncbi:hypothetical protein [Parvularcula marina]|uniref:Uncharacterized protein n=1 Tax=Parvularcula marina TaxID=2292771 RepID=A0A371RK29_9PROT|nr:hypothetical protein [Parvularcula marina]RFB05800.1 hypothetical protein DX908_11290 [Parvularcula marina]